MLYYIGIEDLAALALIQSLQNGKRFLSYDTIEAYGNRVIKRLKKDHRKAILVLSRESTEAMFRNYSDFFIEQEENGKLGIALRDDKDIESLIDKFCGYLALDVLRALVNEKVDNQVA